MNLLVCYTPLHVLVAEQIMAEHPGETFDLISACFADTDKQRHYYRRLQAQCRNSCFLVLPSDDGKLKAQKAMLRQAFAEPYHKVFIAALHEAFSRRLLETVAWQHLETFDDGVANLLPEHPHWQKQASLRHRLRYRLFGRLSLPLLRELSSRHYTIYPNLPNVFDNTVPLRLWRESSRSGSPVRETRRVFLSQPIFEGAGCGQANADLSLKVMKALDIDRCLPHPREAFRAQGISYIDTPLIAEDYFLQEAREHPAIRYELYTFYSSAVMHLNGMPNVSVYAVRPAAEWSTSPAIAQLYRVMQAAGIPLIDIAPD